MSGDRLATRTTFNYHISPFIGKSLVNFYDGVVTRL